MPVLCASPAAVTTLWMAGCWSGNQPHPRHVLFVERPGILERGTGGLAPDGRGVGAVAVERRVQVDQVYGFGVQPAQNVEVIARPDRARREVARRLLE